MSFDSNVIDLAQRVGQEIKDVRADMALISVGTGGVQTSTVGAGIVASLNWKELA